MLSKIELSFSYVIMLMALTLSFMFFIMSSNFTFMMQVQFSLEGSEESLMIAEFLAVLHDAFNTTNSSVNFVFYFISGAMFRNALKKAAKNRFRPFAKVT